MKKIVCMLLTAIISVQASTAIAAGKIVFDPTNFGKNMITAAQSVKQTAQMAAQYKTMVDQYMTMLTNVKQLSKEDVAIAVARGVLPPDANQNGGMSSSEALGMAKGVYENYSDLHETMGGMTRTYDDLQQFSLDMSRQSTQTGKSWNDLLALELKQAKSGQLSGRKQFDTLQSLLSQLSNFQARADHLAKTIPQNEGALQMLGTISAQNHLFTDQLSGVLQASIMQAQLSSDKARSEALLRENQLRSSEERYARRDKAIEVLRALKGAK